MTDTRGARAWSRGLDVSRSVEDVNFVRLHAEWHEAFVRRLREVLDAGKLVVANQIVKHRLLLKGMVIHAGLRRYQIRYRLSVLAGEN